ncbi:hypothetical protein FVR03_04600 [Pontibacter qinzhouensis]|uniref:Outer membrane beta-barrel protein n=1 Tax=Pontibacter qinzhouensis TaxID=2603253 RepID=A0A5C8KCR4_9BACT|nr:hypothetical protein FVR03_04600 [Pontibacter qinzhouensis]
MGYGTFRMASMKEMQQTLIKAVEVKAKATDTFGPHLQLGFNLLTNLGENSRLGFFYEQSSTGGRIAYEDYSGEIKVDNIVTYKALGLKLDRSEPIGESRLGFVTGIEANVFFSELRYEIYSRVYDYQESSEEQYAALGIGVKPYAGIQYQTERFHTLLSVGYLASGNRAFHVPGEKDQYLVRNRNNDKLEPGWGGLRFNLTFTFPISF